MTRRYHTLAALWAGVVAGTIAGALALLGVGIGALLGSDVLGSALTVAMAEFLIFGFGGKGSGAMIAVGLSWWLIDLVLGWLNFSLLSERVLTALAYLLIGLSPGMRWSEVAYAGAGPVTAIILSTAILAIWFPQTLVRMNEEAIISVAMISAVRTASRYPYPQE